MTIRVNNVPKAGLQSFPICPIGSDESDFGSQELRSDYSSSEDENSKIGYIGPPNSKKSMQEFRDAVREYGIKDRRGIQFVTNDALRCQVCCEADFGRDSNIQIFPIAYVVVESENIESWKLFTDLYSADLNLGDGDGYTVINDQQKGLDNALKDVLPWVKHRFCTRHIYSNLRKRFPSLTVKRPFWNACCATHHVAHQRAMKDLQKPSKAAHDQLSKLDPKLWSKASFFTHSKDDNVENNMSECFNAWIINERYMPLVIMLQEIHFNLMTRMREKRDEVQKNEALICPRIKKRLYLLVTESRNWTDE
ncbi:uncharacterized protein LOC141696247 [Apium graveolens]|uniref:uncharacterized protein LOC141696247 n=1 Tax=Apium graveolens TaxID=4045 RepID=UPI003D7B2F93